MPKKSLSQLYAEGQVDSFIRESLGDEVPEGETVQYEISEGFTDEGIPGFVLDVVRKNSGKAVQVMRRKTTLTIGSPDTADALALAFDPGQDDRTVQTTIVDNGDGTFTQTMQYLVMDGPPIAGTYSIGPIHSNPQPAPIPVIAGIWEIAPDPGQPAAPEPEVLTIAGINVARIALLEQIANYSRQWTGAAAEQREADGQRYTQLIGFRESALKNLKAALKELDALPDIGGLTSDQVADMTIDKGTLMSLSPGLRKLVRDILTIDLPEDATGTLDVKLQLRPGQAVSFRPEDFRLDVQRDEAGLFLERRNAMEGEEIEGSVTNEDGTTLDYAADEGLEIVMDARFQDEGQSRVYQEILDPTGTFVIDQKPVPGPSGQDAGQKSNQGRRGAK